LFVLMGLIPPEKEAAGQYGRLFSTGPYETFAGMETVRKIDYGRLALQRLMLAVVTAGALLLVPRPPSGSD
jgi:hypothetical protein